MTLPDIPHAVLQFISAKIDTVPQLEALLLLWENQGRPWTVDEVAARIYVPPEAAGVILHHLQQHRLVSLQAVPPAAVSYEYHGGWDPSATLMTEVAATYRRHLIPVATFIHSKAPSAVREFARAFDFKKER
jgi:hypothetical protein